MASILPNSSGTPRKLAPGSRRLLLEGAALGAVYGILLRLFISSTLINTWVAAHDSGGVTGVMTWAFVLGGPFVIGFLCVSRASRLSSIGWLASVSLPWLSVLAMMGALLLFLIEGFICIIMALPIALLLGSLGGVAAKLYRDIRNPSAATLSCIALLPVLAAPVEARMFSPRQTREVASEIRIHATAATVWKNIERVPAIAPAELHKTWTHRIGFPRPVEATLSYEGVGGVRHASFERGLLFVETVTTWEPEHRLAFSIKADSENIPTTTLDEHVTIGGRYFDVLDGEYSLEPLPDGDIMLHLISHQRLSTDFNGYAGLWTDAVMQNLQSSILEVIKHRCEHA